MYKMASHEPFKHLQHKLSSKEGPSFKLVVWLLTRSWCVQVECHTQLESSWGEIQLYFRLHPNQRSELEVKSSQSPRSLNRDSFGTLPWKSRDKKSFGCRSYGRTQRILYERRWWLPPSPSRDESSESVLPMACPNTKVVIEWRLTNL
jgi:hypothetical protein